MLFLSACKAQLQCHKYLFQSNCQYSPNQSNYTLPGSPGGIYQQDNLLSHQSSTFLIPAKYSIASPAMSCGSERFGYCSHKGKNASPAERFILLEGV